MTHKPSTTIETDEIELTAEYGTAVATTPRHQTDFRNHRPEPHPEAGGTGRSDVDDATSTD